MDQFLAVLIFLLPTIAVIFGGYIFYKRWRGESGEEIRVYFLTNDWRIVSKDLPVEPNLQIALWHKRKQAVFDDGDAIFEDEKGRMTMLATLDSAVPVFPTEDDEFRERKAEAYKSIEAQLALRACDRDENNIQKQEQTDKFQETVQILLLAGGALIGLLVLAWIATSGVSFSCASPY